MAVMEYLKALNEQKTLLSTYLNAKGVHAEESETFNSLVPKVLMIESGNSKSTRKNLFHFSMPDRYGDTIFAVFQNGIRNLESFISHGNRFCCAENQYTLCYSQEDFSWDGHVYTASTEAFSTDENTVIVMTYCSGVTERGEMYLVPADGKKADDTVQNYIYTSVCSGNRYELSFHWLDCSEFISELIHCSGVTAGKYYLCWVGRSDNTHPVISDITIIF